ncbi:MAG: prolyl oligopeptidase family protein [Mucilaginibacter sp.]|nr:prolyl oligopeptidase family protein [Mucilaginibacter sp.]
MNRLSAFLIICAVCCNAAFAPKVIAQNVRRIPPEGITVGDNDRDELGVGLLQLGKDIEALKHKKDPFITSLLPDVMIYYKAVDYALKYQEFFAPKDVISGKKILQEGLARAKALKDKKAPWANQKGEVVRGYISKIDGSVQPYGVTVPDNYQASGPAFDLSLWFHGRGETLSEVNFIADGKGFTGSMPAMKNTIMLYPYGRYCNAFKFAGEVDVLEALADAKKKYKINDNGLFDRGFSMGGAAAWQFAVHYPDMWLAANPGAGFSETVDFMLKYGHEELHPTEYEKTLWHLYDCTDYAGNLSNLPLYAYNGDKDPQQQAADIMEVAMKKEGLKLNRIWGINMGHGYTKAAAKTVDSLLAIDQAKGKNPAPADLHFTTYTLKYNKMYWLQIDALGEHWSKARVDGSVTGNTITLKTKNVTALSLITSQLSGLLKNGNAARLKIDDTDLKITTTKAEVLSFHVEHGKWLHEPAITPFAKKHNLQGPIDDAFMSAFIVVKPSGISSNTLFDKWSKAEMNRFIEQWRAQFRGDPVVKMDYEVTAADMSSSLILFGDAQSNKQIALLNGKLPIKWTDTQILAGNATYPAKDHGLIMIYPNPQNQKHYVVLNSGFTFREDAYLNNSKQIPMLPDWAIVDLNTLPDAVHPGKIASAGFFGEHWEWKEPKD